MTLNVLSNGGGRGWRGVRKLGIKNIPFFYKYKKWAMIKVNDLHISQYKIWAVEQEGGQKELSNMYPHWKSSFAATFSPFLVQQIGTILDGYKKRRRFFFCPEQYTVCIKKRKEKLKFCMQNGVSTNGRWISWQRGFCVGRARWKGGELKTFVKGKGLEPWQKRDQMIKDKTSVQASDLVTLKGSSAQENGVYPSLPSVMSSFRNSLTILNGKG